MEEKEEPSAKASKAEDGSRVETTPAAGLGESKRERKRREHAERRKEKRKAKRKDQVDRIEAEGVVTAQQLAETEYELDVGQGLTVPLRRVRPYFFEFRVFAKERWIGSRVVDVFAAEFGLPMSFYEAQAVSGKLRVNGEVVTADRKIGHGDLVTNVVHRHEPPVDGRRVTFIAQTDELVVVDKPPSVPIHPCGAYRHNSLVFILAKEHGLTNLHSIHRIDRMTSGVMMLAKSTDLASKYMKMIQQGQTQKTYLARVSGQFPEGRTVVDQPIELLQQTAGRGAKNRVGPDGKSAKTIFESLLFDEASNTTVISCKPLTGRTHQIRVHLEWLGHPIANDPVYNPAISGSKRPWALDDDEGAALPPAQPPPPEAEALQAGATSTSTAAAAGGAAPDCPWCARQWRDPRPEELVMWLHALCYEGPGWRFEAPAPDWALGALSCRQQPTVAAAATATTTTPRPLTKESIKEALAKNSVVTFSDDPPHAAVLALLRAPEPRNEADGPELILEQRTQELKEHPGEVCFAGGRHEPTSDPTPASTALREAKEEIGIEEKDVEIIGRLSDYCVRASSKKHVRIAPFVGWLSESAKPPTVASTGEVSRLVFVKLREVARGLREESLEIVDPAGVSKLFPIYRFPCHSSDGSSVESWGATAHMVVDLISACGLLPDSVQHPNLRPSPQDIDSASNRAFHKHPLRGIPDAERLVRPIK